MLRSENADIMKKRKAALQSAFNLFKFCTHHDGPREDFILHKEWITAG